MILNSSRETSNDKPMCPYLNSIHAFSNNEKHIAELNDVQIRTTILNRCEFYLRIMKVGARPGFHSVMCAVLSAIQVSR